MPDRHEQQSELHDLQAERALLGAVLADHAVLRVEGPQTSAADFHSPVHQRIWAAMLECARGGRAVDHLVLADVLKARGELATVGGPAYLMKLDQLVPLAQHAGEYAAIVRDRARRRRLVELAKSLEAAAGELRTSPLDAAARAQADLVKLTQGAAPLKTGGAFLLEYFDALERARAGEVTRCLPTGVDLWDQVVGGLEAKTLTFLGGQAGTAKSGLAGTFLRNTAMAGSPGGLFSLEDDGTWLPERVLSLEAAVPVHLMAKKPKLLTDGDLHELARGAEVAHPYLERILVDDRPLRTPAEIARIAREMVRRGARWIVVDNLSKVDWQTRHYDRRDIAIGEGLNLWDATCKELDVPWVCLAHMKAGKDPYDKPDLNDFAEAMWIGRFARCAAAVYMERGDATVRNIAILKQTRGKGDVEIQLRFRKGAILFESANGSVEGLGYDDDARELREARTNDVRARAAGDFTQPPEEDR